MPKLTEQIIVDIIRHEFALPADNIWIQSQNKKIPNTKDLFVIVGMAGTPQVISNTNNVFPTDAGMSERQTVTVREPIQIDILSRSNDAISRRWEILLALVSVYSVQQQEKNYMKIFEIPDSFNNTSDAEGGSEINRFTALVVCHALHFKEKVLSSPNGDYYDGFDARVDDAITIEQDTGLIEFNITE